MTLLSPELKNAWKLALEKCASPWIACGLDAQADSLAARVEGVAGLIDWSIHGQVSQLLHKGTLAAGDFCLLPGDPKRKRPSFLLYHFDDKPDAKAFAKQVSSLQVDSICLIESTFPEDFLSKLKQTFKRENIRCTQLEPDSK